MQKVFCVGERLDTAQAKKVRLMSDKLDKHYMDLLKEMVNERKPDEPVEEVLSLFCQRQGVSIGTCRVYYKKLVDKGEIKEK
jgi:vacuolar-type H+-ATPase subunit C/Vma6